MGHVSNLRVMIVKTTESIVCPFPSHMSAIEALQKRRGMETLPNTSNFPLRVETTFHTFPPLLKDVRGSFLCITGAPQVKEMMPMKVLVPHPFDSEDGILSSPLLSAHSTPSDDRLTEFGDDPSSDALFTGVNDEPIILQDRPRSRL